MKTLDRELRRSFRLEPYNQFLAHQQKFEELRKNILRDFQNDPDFHYAIQVFDMKMRIALLGNKKEEQFDNITEIINKAKKETMDYLKNRKLIMDSIRELKDTPLNLTEAEKEEFFSKINSFDLEKAIGEAKQKIRRDLKLSVT